MTSLILFLPEINSMSARVLLILVIPGHLIFLYVIYLVEGHSVPNSKTFVVFYLLAGLIQVRTSVIAAKQHSVVEQPASFLPCPGRDAGEVGLRVPEHAGHSPHLPEVRSLHSPRPLHTPYWILHIPHSAVALITPPSLRKAQSILHTAHSTLLTGGSGAVLRIEHVAMKQADEQIQLVNWAMCMSHYRRCEQGAGLCCGTANRHVWTFLTTGW